MEWLKGLLAKLLGKQVDGVQGASRTKIVALIAVILPGIETISAAWGHPIVIPTIVYQFLAGAGLWTLRDAIKS